MIFLVFMGFIWFAVTPVLAQTPQSRAVDSLAAELVALKSRMAELMKRQAATDDLMRDILATLRRIESAARTDSRTARSENVPPSCEPKRVSKNQWLKFELDGCATLAETGESISFTLRMQNITSSDTLYVGARCCYAEWMSVVDDAGQAWTGTQQTVTALPSRIHKDLIELTPGNEFTVSAVVSRQNARVPISRAPRTITITGELIRRTTEEQRTADRARSSLGYPRGRPFTFSIGELPLKSPE